MVVSPLKHDRDIAANRALAESLGILSSIIWVEGQTLVELPDYLAMASVAVISRPNIPGHPIKLLNYMAAGKAIVCFAGAAKGVRHMHDAYVVPDHDVHEMSRGIVAMLRDSELADRLGVAAKETVTRDFDWRRLCTAVEAVYNIMDEPDFVPVAPAANHTLKTGDETLAKQEAARTGVGSVAR